MSWIPLLGELDNEHNNKFDDNHRNNNNSIRRTPMSMIQQQQQQQYPTTSGTTDIGYQYQYHHHYYDIGLVEDSELAAVDWYYTNLLRGRSKPSKKATTTSTTTRMHRKLIGIIGQDDSADMQAQYYNLRGLEIQKNDVDRNANNNNTTGNNDLLNMTSWTITSSGFLILLGVALIAYKRRMFSNNNNKSHSHVYEG